MLDIQKIYSSNNYGDMKVIEYINANNVVVEFVDTGSQVKSSTGNIIKGLVKDANSLKLFSNSCIGKTFKSNKYGFFKILKYKSDKEIIIEFIDTGYVTTTTGNQLKSGRVKDVTKPIIYNIGYFGKGSYISRYKGKLLPRYNAWANMLKRCYCPESHIKLPTYKDCTVAKIWHNYQKFAEWYDTNYPTDGGTYELDKDIKIKGNRVYSPDTCMFVTSKENTVEASAKHYKLVSPCGANIDVYNMREFCKKNNLIATHMSKVVSGKLNQHKGWTAHDTNR